MPLLCRACCRQDVRCLTTVAGENQSVGSIRQGYVEIKSNLFRRKRNEKKEEEGKEILLNCYS